MEERLLLHVCCGPCSLGAIEALKLEYAVTLFWSNSNISPREEHDRRLAAARTVAEKTGLDLFVDGYRHDLWLEKVKGLEKEPERGKRCARCFAYSFERAASFAAEKGFPLFTTTLTVSPHKDARLIFGLGKEAAARHQVEYLERDLKKKQGFQNSTRLSKEHGIYRQRYCGCEFSMRG